MNPTTKIAHIITLLEFGGAQQNTLYTVNHLGRAEFTPILIAGRGAYLDRDVPADSTARTYLIGYLRRSINPVYDLCAFIKIYLLIKREKPVIVHTHSSKAGILGRWAAWCARVPVIIHTYHGFSFHRYQNFLVHRLYTFIERLTALITDRIICVSSENIEYALFKKIGKKSQYHLIRSGITIAAFRAGSPAPDSVKKDLHIPQGNRVITMTACFKQQKNCIDFVRTAEILLTKSPVQTLTFLLIGEGKLRYAIEKEIIRRGVEKHFILPGWHRDIPGILRITDIFVLTSLWEGLPRAVVEALSAGVPVVANAVDGVREVVRNNFNGYTVKPLDVTTMAEHLNRILTQPPLRATLSRNASTSIGTEFDIDHMVSQQEQLYRELIQKTPCP